MLSRGKNPGDVWNLPTAGFKGPHLAVFPEKLIEIPIRATCPPRGLVLDPFAGSGTVALTALSLGRRAILSDLSYQSLQLKRIRERFPGARIALQKRGGWFNTGEGLFAEG